MAKIVPIPKKDKTHRPILLLPVISKVMERLVLARVKWSAQPINPYSLGFRSGVGTIDAIATLLHRAAPITTLRSGYKSRAVTIFLDLEKAFELVSKEVLLESAALLGIRGRLLSWLDDYLTSRTGAVHFQGKTSKVNLGLKFSPEKCEALWYRSVDPGWNFKIAGARIPMAAISQVPRGSS